METKIPTIRGVYVNSHIKALQKAKGRDAIKELRRLYGKPLEFGNFQNIPIEEELKIMHAVFNLLSSSPVINENFDYEAGKFHFQNFMTAPLTKLFFSLFGKNFRTVVWAASKVSKGIFTGVQVRKKNAGIHTEQIILENNEYPAHHFVGFFDAWLTHLGLIGMTTMKELSPRVHEYTVTWKEK
jgi:hypothetical protein